MLGDEGTGKLSVGNSELLHDAAQRLVSDGAVPGVCVISSVSGQRATGFGGYANLETSIPMLDDTRFEISCLMKLLTSLVALQLAERDELDLNAPIGHYLPDLRASAPIKASSISVTHLLSHTSGYSGLNLEEAAVKWGMTWTKFVEYFTKSEQLFPPGSVPNYEHSEHVVLGEILRHITGKKPIELVEEVVFEPLNITPTFARPDDEYHATQYHRTPDGLFHRIAFPRLCNFWEASLGNICLNLDEVTRIGEALLGSAPGFPKLASDFVMEHLRNRLIDVPQGITNATNERFPSAFGYGCSHHQYGVLGHNGSSAGLTCALRLVPSCRGVFAAVVNTWVPYARDQMLEEAASSFVDVQLGQPKPRFLLSDLCGLFEPRDLEGTYVGSYGGQIEVTFMNGIIKGQRHSRLGTLLCFEVNVMEGFAAPTIHNPTSVVFFSHPTEGCPCLSLGVHTYKRTD